MELYKGGIIPLSEFATMKYNRDILVRLIVKKTSSKFVYQYMRNQSTDFPVLTCCVSYVNGAHGAVIGARPSRAMLLEDEEHILSCSTLAVRADGHEVHTLEGLQEEAAEFIEYIAAQGADQCGFRNPGLVMNTIALLRENQNPTDDEIRAYLAGNLCRCSGYDGQLRGIRGYLDSRKA